MAVRSCKEQPLCVHRLANGRLIISERAESAVQRQPRCSEEPWTGTAEQNANGVQTSAISLSWCQILHSLMTHLINEGTGNVIVSKRERKGKSVR